MQPMRVPACSVMAALFAVTGMGWGDPNDVIVNEFFYNDDGWQSYPGIGNQTISGDWVELLVVRWPGVDMRGWAITDKNEPHSGSEGYVTFPSASSFEAVPQGTRVVCALSPGNGSLTEDLDSSDSVMLAKLDSDGGQLMRNGSLSISNTDEQIVLLSGPPLLGTGVDMVMEGNTADAGDFGLVFFHPFSHLGSDEGCFFTHHGDGGFNNDDGEDGWETEMGYGQASPGGLNPGQSAPPAGGDDPDASVGPIPMDFGIIDESTTADLVLQVTNAATATLDLDVAGILPVDGDTGEFAVIGSPPVGISPGSATVLHIRYSPGLGEGMPHSAVFCLDSSDSHDPFFICRGRTFGGAAVGQVIVRSFAANPNDGFSVGDFSRDGIADSLKDEFVSVRNVCGEAVYLAGWTLSDSLSVRHVFGEVVISGSEEFYVFAAGVGGWLDPERAFESSAGGLSLNNSGDTVYIRDSTGMVIDSVSYGLGSGGLYSVGGGASLGGSNRRDETSAESSWSDEGQSVTIQRIDHYLTPEQSGVHAAAWLGY